MHEVTRLNPRRFSSCRRNLGRWGIPALALLFWLGQARAQAELPPVPQCQAGTVNPDGSARSYQDYALCMAGELDVAIAKYRAGDYAGTRDAINAAYFDWYENMLEPQSMILPGNRKVKLESQFSQARIALQTDPQAADTPAQLNAIKLAVARDAMVLDGVLDRSAPDEAGRALFIQGTKRRLATCKQWWTL